MASQHGSDQVRQFLADRIQWLGQSAFLITTRGGQTVYIDPFVVPKDPPPADVVFLTHSHGDHYNPKALAKIRRASTRVVATEDLRGIATDVLAPGQRLVIGDLTVQAYPAYNLRGFPHPKTKGWVGYLLTIDGFQVYHAGDTDAGAELVGMNPDVAFLPIAGFVTLGVQAGAAVARGVGATITVPIHYGLIPGTGKNGEKFLRAYEGEAVLLTRHP